MPAQEKTKIQNPKGSLWSVYCFCTIAKSNYGEVQSGATWTLLGLMLIFLEFSIKKF